MPGLDLAEVLERAASVADETLAPNAERTDADARWPREGLRALQDAGLGGLTVPREHGGHGFGLFATARVCEVIAKRCASTAMCFGMHLVGSAVLSAKATKEQAERFLQPIVEGRHLTTLALSEPGTGSHFWIPETRVTHEGAMLRIDGEKAFVTNGQHADSYVISVAGSDDQPGQFSCIVLERDAPGATWGAAWQGMGMRGNSSTSLRLDDVRLSTDNLLGAEGDQTWYMFSVIAPHFLSAMAGTYLGIAEGALDEATRAIIDRRLDHTARSLAMESVPQHHVGELWALVARTRALVHMATAAGDAAHPDALPTIMSAKAEAASCATEATDRALVLAGGARFRRARPTEPSVPGRAGGSRDVAHHRHPALVGRSVGLGRAALDRLGPDLMILLLGVPASATASLRSQLNAYGEEVPATVSTTAEVAELSAAGKADLLVVGAANGEVQTVLHALRVVDREMPVVFLRERDEKSALEERLRFVPMHGRRVVVKALSPDLVRDLVAMLQERRRRLRHRRAVDVMHAAEATPPPALARAAQYLDRLLLHAPMGVVFTDLQGVILAPNPEARRLLDLDERGTHDPRLQDLFDAPDRGHVEQLLQEVDGVTAGMLATRSMGKERQHLELSAARLTGSHDEPAIMIILHDVTERVQAEQNLRDAREVLAVQQRLAALGSLVAGVAHEVRTPLAYISNHVHYVQHKLDAIARQHPEVASQFEALSPSLVEAVEGVERINRLVRDLRKLTRLQDETRMPAQLDEVVEEALPLFRAVQPAGFPLEVDLQSTRPVVLDKGHIQQVVLNLLDNAADAIGAAGHVRISTRDTFDGVELKVVDDGTGISEEVRDKIFDPLVTTKPEGTGLGLSIVDRLVRDHGGTIEVETGAGGTTFTVTLPADGNGRASPSAADASAQ